jgi:predicted RNA-binding protein with EMAP domain
MDEEINRIIELLESIDSRLEGLTQSYFTDPDRSISEKLDAILAKLEDIDVSISNIDVGG